MSTTSPTSAPSARPLGRPPAATAPADHEGPLDLVVPGLATLRLVGHGRAERRAAEAQFGPAVPAGSGPADVTVRYVERLERTGVLRFLGPGEAGFSDDGFVVLQGRFRRAVQVRLPLADLGGPCEVVCEHGVGRVPHLVALVNLAVLANGGLALHAAGFELDGTATLATGWSKGGKTEALLAFCQRGARFVADEWAHIRPDGRVSGLHEPVRVWDWQLDQLPSVRQTLDGADRARLGALRSADRAARASRRSARVRTVVGRQRFVDLRPEQVAPFGRVDGPVPLGTVFLVTSAQVPATELRPVTGREVASRMAGSLAHERAPLLGLVDAFRYAFPAAVPHALHELLALEPERLHQRLDHVEAAEVLHPYPVDLDELADVLSTPKERWT